MEPQLDFWRQVVWEMIENTIDEYKEAVGGLLKMDKSKEGGLGIP